MVMTSSFFCFQGVTGSHRDMASFIEVYKSPSVLQTRPDRQKPKRTDPLRIYFIRKNYVIIWSPFWQAGLIQAIEKILIRFMLIFHPLTLILFSVGSRLFRKSDNIRSAPLPRSYRYQARCWSLTRQRGDQRCQDPT